MKHGHWLLLWCLSLPAWAAQPDPAMLAQIADLHARAGSTSPLAASAHAWLDFAQEEFIELDNTGVAEDALARAQQLVDWIEHGQGHAVAAPDPVRGSVRVREDLWQRWAALVSKPCAQVWRGPAEVKLIWAGHEQPELGERHASQQVQDAEWRLQQAENCAEPSPVVPAPSAEQRLPLDAPIVPPPVKSVSRPPTLEKIPNVVHFATDRAELSVASRAALQQVLTALQTYPQLHLRLGGHADSRGNARYNLRLSERRVAAVRQYLLQQGMPASRLEVQAFGMQRTQPGKPTLLSRARDRRVELQLVNPQVVQHLQSEVQERDLQK